VCQRERVTEGICLDDAEAGGGRPVARREVNAEHVGVHNEEIKLIWEGGDAAGIDVVAEVKTSCFGRPPDFDPAADHHRRRRDRGGGPLTGFGPVCPAIGMRTSGRSRWARL